jgi:predicted  nucleic acid-binding Zn-ribbon protein
MCKKDIKCIKCGWEWNKKDSELWDMYVCHKCGFDNITFYTSTIINNYNRGGRI